MDKFKYGTILVTGGTGTFGNAFTQRVLTNGLVRRIIILSRDEKKQQDMRARFSEYSSQVRFILADIKDREILERAFKGVDIVIHAAAYKQLPRSFLDFEAFLQVNVYGTHNVCQAAHVAGVKRVIFLSSDKGCAATTPYGATKAVAEWIVLNANVLGDCRFTCLRYGNVLNSRGSVLGVWRRQHANHETFTITDERMTRFWMTIDQAVDLTLTAIDKGRGGEIFIPRHIRRGSVVDLFKEFYPGQRYEVIGKAGYEKLTEALIDGEEADRAVSDGEVFIITPPRNYIRWLPHPYGTVLGEGRRLSHGMHYRSDPNPSDGLSI